MRLKNMELSDTDEDLFVNSNSPSMLTDLQSLEPVCYERHVEEFANDPEAVGQNIINCKITDEPFLVSHSTLPTQKCIEDRETNDEKALDLLNSNLVTSNYFDARNQNKVIYKVIDEEITSVICVLYDENKRNDQCNITNKVKRKMKENREEYFLLKMQESDNNCRLEADPRKLVYESDDYELLSPLIITDDVEPTKKDELNCVRNHQFTEMSAFEKEQQKNNLSVSNDKKYIDSINLLEKDDKIINQCPGRKRRIIISNEDDEINEKITKGRRNSCINKSKNSKKCKKLQKPANEEIIQEYFNKVDSIISCSSMCEKNINKVNNDKVNKAVVIDKYDYETEKVIFNHYSDEYNEDINNEVDEEERNNSNWINVTQSDSLPIHFNFTVQPGIRLSRKEIGKPVDYFKLLFTEEIINMLIDETNYNALRKISKRKTKKSQSWINLNSTSFYTFIAILINMGLNPRKDIESYWTYRKCQFMPYFPFTMSKTYFLNIFSNFHLRNFNNEESSQSNFQIKELFDKLTKNFQKYRLPCQALKIDEVTVNSKGRTCFKINHPTKATNGIIMKMFMLSEPDTGYVYGLEPYSENEQNQKKYRHLPISSQIALNLIDKLLQSFPSKGYHFYTDHYFSCPELAKELYKRNCHLTGTVCMNKKDMPINLKCNKSDKGMTALRNNELLVLYWYQVKPICLLSNYHTTNVLEVSSKFPESKHMVRPVIVRDYLRNMKGISLEDYFMISSAIIRKNIHWYKRYFFWLLDLCLINAHILYKLHCNRLKEEIKYNHIDFRLEIVEALSTRMVKYKKQSSPSDKEKMHTPDKLKKPKPCIVCNKEKCWTYCETCGEDKAMHIGRCFKKYHSQKD